jgi:hypothetical protein
MRAACEAIEPRLYLTASLGAANTVATPGATAPLTAGDFNGAASPVDLAVATPAAVQILTGSGAGAFTTGSTIPLPAAGTPFLAGNFTGSATDIVLLSQDPLTQFGTVTYETNSGTGIFTAGATSSITDGGIGFSPLFATTGDFNGDGHTDLAIVGRAPGISSLTLAVLLSDNDGTFTEANDYSVSTSNSISINTGDGILAADLGNGHTDVVVNDFSSGSLDVFMGNGDGSFNALGGTPFAASLITAAAITGSPDLDIVGANSNQLNVLIGDGAGGFRVGSSPVTLANPIMALGAADYDGDGKADVITDQGLLLSNGDGTFQAPIALPQTTGGGGALTGMLSSADINGDGKPDVVGLDAAGNAVDSALNTSTGASSVAVTSNAARPGALTDVQFTAKVSSAFPGVPSGTVDFFDAGTQIGSATVSGGSAVFDAGTTLTLGTHTITATYNGDSSFGPSTSAPITQMILPASITTVTSSDNPALPGDTITFTATVVGVGGVPTGNVEFFDGATDLGGGTLNGADTAALSTAVLAAGQHSITAQYQGDLIFGTSASAVLTQSVGQPTLVPIVTASTVPAHVVGGSKVHGNATITLTNVTPATITGAVTINLFASPDANVADGVMVTAIPHKHLKVKSQQTVKLKVSIKALPATLADGSYILLAQAIDPNGNASSARMGPSVSVAAPFVQLAASGVSAVKPAAIAAGKKGTVSLVITNNGNVPTTGKAMVNVALSTDGQTPADALVTQSVNLVVKPGRSKKMSLHLAIPATQAAGMYFPYVSVTQNGSTTMAVGASMFTVG